MPNTNEFLIVLYIVGKEIFKVFKENIVILVMWSMHLHIALYRILTGQELVVSPRDYLLLLTKLKAVKDLATLDKYLVQLADSLKMDRMIIYKIVDEKTALVVALHSTMKGEKMKVSSLVRIGDNRNLFEAIKTRQISAIPVPGVGEDAVIPINGMYFLGVDDSKIAKVMSEESLFLLRVVANSLEGILKFRDLLLRAVTDPLTKALNRAALELHLKNRIDPFDEALPEHTAMIFIDIDHFGLFNKDHGHEAGDEVLRRVFEELSRTVSNNGFVYRFGGEEIVIILHDGNTMKIAEELRKNIETLKVKWEDKVLSVTISVGVCTDENRKKAITKSNHALLYAKECGKNADGKTIGRNNVVLYSDAVRLYEEENLVDNG